MSSIPYRQHVYILLITQVTERAVSTAVGAVFHTRLDADRAARSPQYEGPEIACQIIEREVRGEPAQPRTLPASAAE